jgi:RNA polymerase sigma factor (sigma-70 family)
MSIATAIVELNEFALRIIRRKGRQLAAKRYFSRSDRPDLEQELTIHLWQALEQFDPEIAHYNAFVTTIVERHAASLIRRRLAKKRNPQREVSLDALIELSHSEVDEDGNDASDELLGEQFWDRGDEQELNQLTDDLDQVLARLSVSQRMLCERLKFETVSQVAESMSLPRSTLRAAINRLRMRFKAAAMEKYLANGPSGSAQTE